MTTASEPCPHLLEWLSAQPSHAIEGTTTGRAAVGYVHCVSATFLGKDQWKEDLRAFLKTARPALPPAVGAVIQREAPLALAFLEFSRKFREESMQTPYPAALQTELANLGNLFT